MLIKVIVWRKLFLFFKIPLHEILNAMFAKAGIDDNTEVLVTSTFYLGKMSNILATVDRSALNNYVIWSLVKEYLPFLSQMYTDTYYVYNREVTGQFLRRRADRN